MYVSVSVKLDRSIKAEQAIGSVIRTDKKKKDFVVAATKPRGNIPFRNAQKQQIYLKAFLWKVQLELVFPIFEHIDN